MQTNEIELELNYHKNQAKIFFENDSRYKIIAKGRRFGLTRGFATYITHLTHEVNNCK